jgi:hypothetical protein
MILILIAVLFTFISYYFACIFFANTNKKLFFTGVFIVCSFLGRLIINVNLNNDYLLYYNFDIFKKPSGVLSYILNEPYLYSAYAFFTLFIDSKKDVFLALYWFNFIISTFFFVWLLFREDIEAWKKMLLFVIHYFLFGYVLLRNGPAYILFVLYFYYAFREKRFDWVLITPFMHISSSLMLVTYFHKSRNYFKVLLVGTVVIFCLVFILKPFLSSIVEFDSILYKISVYLQGMNGVGVLHILFFLFISFLVIMGSIFYKNEMLHPILITTVLFYSVTFFINPIVAYRFSPYVIFALLLFPFDKMKNEKIVFIMNRLTILLFPLFVYSLFSAHRTEGFKALFFN